MRTTFATALALLSLVTLASFDARAEAPKLDHASEAAMNETQSLLGDQKAMESLAKTNPDAGKAMDQVSSLTGGNSADSAAVYKLASDIFANMAKETGGDGAGMEKILADAMRNPESFAAKLSPEQRQQLQSLTKSIETRAPSTLPH